MNKIRGSVIAKLIAWFLCISCALGTAFFGILTIVGVEEGYFGATREEILTKVYRNVNSMYSADAYQNMKHHRSQKALTDDGFRYGILQAEDLSYVDFQSRETYLDTNMTKDELLNIDKDKIYLYEIYETSDGGCEGSAYGCIGDWEDLSALESISGHLEEQNSIVRNSQYADAVCFDTVKGIFYYRSDEHYYPAQSVSLFYTDHSGAVKEYNYFFDFEKGKYFLSYYAYLDDYGQAYEIQNDVFVSGGLENRDLSEKDITNLPDEEILNLEAEDVIETEKNNSVEVTQHNYYSERIDVEKILGGSEEDGYVDLSKLKQTDFYINDWEGIELDNVRVIDGDELTLINSDTIDKKYFIASDVPGYYLDDNYTLHVAQEVEVSSYWVASLIPDVNQPVAEGSEYQSAARGIELFYLYGNNAYVTAIVLAIMTLMSFIFLVYACGYRKNQEGIVLTWFDRLPLEVISAAAFFAVLVPYGIIESIVHTDRIFLNNINLFITLIVIGAAGFCMIALWYVLSLCVRIKYGKWWRNSICYKIWHFCWKVIKKLYDNIALLWKLMLIIFVKSVFELFIMAACQAAAALVLFWLIETVLLSVAAFYAVLQINELQKAAAKMADGNLNYKVRTEKMFSPCKMHGNNLNKIGDGLSKAVDERMKSERFKTELITNVSHDIKTPLTSIINYVDLLEKEELHNEKAEEYLEVLERQSSKLKKLIEDLVEASKASTGNLEVGNELLEAGVFLTQTVGEFEEKLSLSGLELIVQKPEEQLYILADGRHLWRVVDNLMNNICKYAQPSSRVYVNLEKKDEDVVITFRNISKYQLNINGGDLMERFVRGDSSRNTEGHGLGLSIAKSLMDLIGGEMQIVVDGDLFKVILRFQMQHNENETENAGNSSD